jgi:peptide chain release factor subunit 1
MSATADVVTLGTDTPALTVELLRRLAVLEGDPAVTSVYLDVDGRRHPTLAECHSRFRVLARRCRGQAAASAGAGVVASVELDLDGMARWLAHSLDRSSTRGVAMFGCAHDGWLEVVSLPHAVRDQAVVERTAHLRQLELAMEHVRRFLVVLVDRRRGRLIRCCTGRLEELAAVVAPREAIESQRGPWAVGMDARLDEHERRHLAHVHAALEDALGDQPADHIVLGGPAEEVARFEELLSPALRHRVAGRIAVSAVASPAAVRKALRPVESALEAAEVDDAVMRLHAGVAGGVAVAGLAPTCAALHERRLDTLVVDCALEAAGTRCVWCGLLGPAGRRRCSACGGSTRAVADAVDEAIEVALATHCTVVTVEEGARMADLGGIGGLLRF